jgi:hypothetical protein
MQIPIRTHATQKDEKQQPVTTVSFIRRIFDIPGQPVIPLSEMYRRFKMLQKLDEVNAESTVVEFDEGELKSLQEFVKLLQMQYDPFVIQFAQDIGIDMDALLETEAKK